MHFVAGWMGTIFSVGLSFGILFSASLPPVLFTIRYAKQIGLSLQRAAEPFTVVYIALGFVASVFPLPNALVGATFGRQSFPRAMGLLYVVELPFQLLSAPVGGFVSDPTGDCAAPFRYSLPVFLVAALLLVFVKDGPAQEGAPPGWSLAVRLKRGTASERGLMPFIVDANTL